MIRLFNTLGRELQEFSPLNPGEVKMYTCGPTVWNFPHIGNYRTFLFEDLLRRFLKYRGYKVTQVMNLTDIDDRIIKVCKEQNVDRIEITKKYANAFFEDLIFLRVEPAEFYPYATENIAEMVKIISSLLKQGYAYKADDGSIYYSISKFNGYGRLSGLKISELKPGARVRQDDYDKTSAEDFALWKSWDENDGNIFWETELGKGRPGWHIECSAMSMKYLGEEFDIHTGGVDNIFPHHENEIAQSEAYTGKKFARFWLHSAHLLINDQKMAKRLGNFITVPQLRDQGVDGPSLRFLLLTGRYREQLNFTEHSLKQASASVERINEFASRVGQAIKSAKILEGNLEVGHLVSKTREDYIAALDNDLDTPSALAVVFHFVTQANKFLDKGISKADAELIRGFLLQDFDSIFAIVGVSEEISSLPSEVRSWLEERENARMSRDWKLADALRIKLLESGIEVQDTNEGQKWRRKTKSLLN